MPSPLPSSLATTPSYRPMLLLSSSMLRVDLIPGAILPDAVLRGATRCHAAMLPDAMPRDAMRCYPMLSCVVLSDVMLLCYVMLCPVMLCYAMLCDAMRCIKKAHPLFEQLRADLLKSEAVVRVVGQVLLGCVRKTPGENRRGLHTTRNVIGLLLISCCCFPSFSPLPPTARLLACSLVSTHARTQARSMLFFSVLSFLRSRMIKHTHSRIYISQSTFFSSLPVCARLPACLLAFKTIEL